jgi:hypothetical protein
VLDEEDQGNKIDRFAILELFVVHFLLRDHLDWHTNLSNKYDVLG